MKPRFSAALFLLAFASVVAFTQQFPASEGTCRIAARGVEACEWMNIPPIGQRTMTATATTYVLAAGAPLEKPVEGQESVLVAMTNGDFINEISSPESKFSLTAGRVVLLPRNQRYKIRNVGDKPATVLMIQLRPYLTKATSAQKAYSTQLDARDSCNEATGVLNTIRDIQAGDTRSKVELNFEEDGGMQFPPQTRYVWKDCKYVKIEVEFSPSGPSESRSFLPTDKVIKVSKPYLELPDMD
jgi:hypothetical protein